MAYLLVEEKHSFEYPIRKEKEPVGKESAARSRPKHTRVYPLATSKDGTASSRP